jgi:hypothetical protein
MDIVKRMILCGAKQPRTEAGKLLLEATNMIEALRQEIRTQRYEIAQHVNVRNALLEMDETPNKWKT